MVFKNYSDSYNSFIISVHGTINFLSAFEILASNASKPRAVTSGVGAGDGGLKAGSMISRTDLVPRLISTLMHSGRSVYHSSGNVTRSERLHCATTKPEVMAPDAYVSHVLASGLHAGLELS